MLVTRTGGSMSSHYVTNDNNHLNKPCLAKYFEFIALVFFMGCLVVSLACFPSDCISFTMMSITVYLSLNKAIYDHLMASPPSVAASTAPDRGTARVRHQRRAWAEKKNL